MSQTEKNGNQLAERMGKIRHKIVVLSGKGGVGKSTVAVNIAASLALQGKRVGLLDVDIHGPSVPTMLNLHDVPMWGDGKGMLPVEMPSIGDLCVMSVGFLLESSDAPVIWRGPMKNNVIKQFLEEVQWGDLDYLVVDCPPGTGDEPLSVIQLMGKADGAVVVTTPQVVSSIDVSKSINFAKKLDLPVLGIVENMSGFVCPHCGKMTEIFRSGAGEKLASKYGVSLLGKIPIDPRIGETGDAGLPIVAAHADSEAARIYTEITKGFISKEN